MKKKKKYILIFLNIVLVLAGIISSLQYSNYIQKNNTEKEIDMFCGTVESMKQISANYLKLELGYANDWAKYISSQKMTVEEALAYIRTTNDQPDRYAHIVDMDTFEAYSTYENENGDDTVTCYQKFYEQGSDTDHIFIENMRQMFSEKDDEVNVLGKYRADESQIIVISVGTHVRLVDENGKSRNYLLLRLIPVESIRKIWIFPVEYQEAEIGVITKSGDYVIASKGMRSLSFLDFIRGYNFEDDYNQVDVLAEELKTTDQGLLTYKNSKGEMCYWYYSAFGYGTGLDIIGSIPVTKIASTDQDWIIVLTTCGVLFLMMLLDGIYILQMNQQLRDTLKLAEDASEAKTRFLSTMSHDIRTPMNAIIGMTEIAKKKMDDPAQLRQCLDKLTLTSEHLLTLINDVLDLSKVESGGMALHPAPFSVTRTIENIISMIKPQMESKHLQFVTEIAEFSRDYLVADEIRINQVYINLLTNAVKYTQDGGKIILRMWEEETPEVEVIRLFFEVEDNGSGMSESFQKKMYEMFARENDGRIDRIEGSGLGLAIVRQIVDMMDGTIQCDSAEGKGTCFRVCLQLPAADEKAQSLVEKDDIERIDISGTHVLVAEDNDLNWEIFCELLSEYGVECTRAVNGQDCIDKLAISADGTYDMIFMDVQMPVMNGKDATRKIRASDRAYEKNMIIVAMTADAFAEDMRACLDAGMNDHIAKPIDMKKVVRLIRAVKESKRGNDYEN